MMNVARVGHSAQQWTRPCGATGQMRSIRTYADQMKAAKEKSRKEMARRAAENNLDKLSDLQKVEMMEEQQLQLSFDPLMRGMSMDLPTQITGIPYKVNWKSFADVKTTGLDNIENTVRNFQAAWTMATYDSFPGVKIPQGGWAEKLAWVRECLQVTSVKPGTWLAPFRQIATHTYEDFNDAVARRDTRKIKILCKSRFRDEALSRMNQLVPRYRYNWNMHREIQPVRVLALRAVPGWFESREPDFGNRLAIQALCRFETEQSLEIYDQTGKPMHAFEGQVIKHRRTPATRRRVLEHLVLEKKMFQDTPWAIREQMWPQPERDLKY